MRVSTIQPGVMVALTVRTKGNVQYAKVDLENGTTDAGEAKARWETTRVIADPEEFKKAQEARSKARTIISAVCARTSFGLIALESKKDKLDEAIRAARAGIDEFNADARMTNLSLSVMLGRIAADDKEAVAAMNAEMRDIIDQMEVAVKNIDAEAIRKAAIAARSAAKVLSPEAAAQVSGAIAASRDFATRIKAAANVASIAVDTVAVQALSTARTAFLDLTTETETVLAESVKPRARVLDNFDDAVQGTTTDAGFDPNTIKAAASSARPLEL